MIFGNTHIGDFKKKSASWVLWGTFFSDHLHFFIGYTWHPLVFPLCSIQTPRGRTPPTQALWQVGRQKPAKECWEIPRKNDEFNRIRTWVRGDTLHYAPSSSLSTVYDVDMDLQLKILILMVWGGITLRRWVSAVATSQLWLAQTSQPPKERIMKRLPKVGHMAANTRRGWFQAAEGIHRCLQEAASNEICHISQHVPLQDYVH